jgi:hypothetical protein
MSPIKIEIFQGRLNRGEVQGPVEMGEEMRVPTQQFLGDEIAKERAVGTAGLSHMASGKKKKRL